MFLYNEPMSRHTTFRVGGPAKVYAKPDKVEDVSSLVDECVKNNDKYIIIGNGSNILFSDEGYDGVVIDLSGLKNIVISETPGKCHVVAQAGVMLGKLGSELAKYSITGFEFASGIPGSIGGAVAMNAGAYGGEIKDCLEWVKVVVPGEGIKVLKAEEVNLEYRHSLILDEHYIVVEAGFEFDYGKKEQIKAYMDELSSKRRQKQPLEFPSAGSTFKRPEGYFAAKLIEDAGLKGYKVGGMQVSPKHAGFVVNTGEGTAKDFVELTNYIKEVVKDKFDVELELEVQLVGFDK